MGDTNWALANFLTVSTLRYIKRDVSHTSCVEGRHSYELSQSLSTAEYEYCVLGLSRNHALRRHAWELQEFWEDSHLLAEMASADIFYVKDDRQ